MGWHVAPDGLRDVLLELNRTYAPREIVITENGAAYPDTVDPDGRVRDAGRVDYLARHVAAAAEALARRRAADRLLRLVAARQLRVEPRLQPAVRPGPRRLRRPSAARRRTARAGISGSSPPGADGCRALRRRAAPRYLTEPARIPRTKARWSSQEHDERHDHRQERARGQQVPRAAVGAEQVEQRRRHDPDVRPGPRNTRATSRSFQTHRNWKIAKAPSAGIESGSTIRMKVWNADAPSIDGGLEQVARQLRHEVVEQEDRERQPERRVGQPDPDEGAVQRRAAVDLEDRDQRHLERHDEQRHDDR